MYVVVPNSDNFSHFPGSLEAEKVDMRAQLQKLQAKFDHQLIVSQQHEQESNSVSSKLQQLELEGTANKHRSEQEIKRLKWVPFKFRWLK